MPRLYYILAKKAIVIATLFSLCWAPIAYARVPNDPGYALQKSVWDQIHAPAAWDTTIGSSRVVVAVIDTGADIWHSDLYKNIWINPYEIPDNGIDDDHNGYVDDTHGWNFVENNNNLHASVSSSSTIQDQQSTTHGTVIAGLVGAMGDNFLDGVGLNWNVKIMPLRAIESNGSGKYSNVIKAIEYAVDNGANIISMSFVGDEPSPLLEDALYRAYEHGVVIVAAAGNHDTDKSGDFDAMPHYPACFNQDHGGHWLITVGSVDAKDKISSFSNYGRCLDIVAPGEGIVSTQWYAPSMGYGAEFSGPWYGTSFAEPLVAGAAALVKSIHPEWSADIIINTVLNSADSVAAANTPSIGVGRLNVANAVAAAAQTLPLPTPWYGSFYSISQNTLWRDTLATNTLTPVFHPWKGTLVAAATAVHDPGEYIFVLYKSGTAYFLRTLTATGRLLNDHQVAIPKNVGTKPQRVVFDAGIDTVGAPVILYDWVDKKNRSTFVLTDFAGNEIASHQFSQSIVTWAYDAQTEQLYWVENKNANTQLRMVNWSTSENAAIALGAVGTVDDIKVTANAVLLTAHTALEARLATFDRGITHSRSIVLATSAKMPAWYMWLVRNNDSASLGAIPFPGGKLGNRSVYAESGELVGSVYVPVVNGLLAR